MSVGSGALLDIADTLARAAQRDLTDPVAFENIIADIGTNAQNALRNEIALHGRRVESMFAYVAAALGKCTLVRQEDIGDIYIESHEDCLVPDYRLILKDGAGLLVEVKNRHSRSPSSTFSMRTRDLLRLERYAQINGLPLLLAIYWSRWRLWTLVRPEDLTVKGLRRRITFSEALVANRMVNLGDFYLGTTPPLRLVLEADSMKPAFMSSEGQASLTIGNVRMWAGQTEVTSNAERSLLMYLWFYGDWSDAGPFALQQNEQLTAIEFYCEPDEFTDRQGFELFPPMSSMIARQFDQLTTESGTIRTLAPVVQPNGLGQRAPGRVGEMTLPLWVFHAQPSGGDVKGDGTVDFG